MGKELDICNPQVWVRRSLSILTLNHAKRGRKAPFLSSQEGIMDYQSFLTSKLVTPRMSGFDVSTDDLPPRLFDWQKAITQWALKLGKSALFEECGLGKTPQQLAWADQVAKHTKGKVIVLTPLAVARQTVREGQKFGIPATYCRSQDEANNAASDIIITNYEMLKAFDPDTYYGVVLDESSILKSFTGKTKRAILDAFEHTPYKLACTATPAPNDHLELGNHAQFLNVMNSTEMISRWFINDSMSAGNYRLKGYAAKDFWGWVASWAVCVSLPSDLGYPDDGFILPELRMHEHRISVDHSRAEKDGRLFLDGTLSATSMWREKRATAEDRCKRALEIVGDSDDTWVLWCDTNYEADILKRLFPTAIDVRGSDSVKSKESKLTAFTNGEYKQIITKPSLAGFGLNWQHCHKMVFVGVSYSFEKLYQALRRTWRFGQGYPVDAYLIYAASEGNIMKTLGEKQGAHHEMQESMTSAMKENGLSSQLDDRALTVPESEVERSEHWELRLGDSVEEIKKIADASIDLTVFSPPFSSLYIYSDSIADMGNSGDDEEFFDHFSYLIPELWRVTTPGRLCAVHCKDLPLYMNRDGAAGLRDFPGEVIRRFEETEPYPGAHDVNDRWVYHSRVTIWKDPVIEMQRTKNHGLLYKNLRKRGQVCRQGMADYLVVFRKWRAKDAMQDAPDVLHDRDDFPLEMWQRYASPVWDDIRQTNTLNSRIARESQDEKHICPLQLDVIERCIELWTNPGDLVFDPFAGIGSTGYVARGMDRDFVGIELKRAYWEWAIKNLSNAETLRLQMSMFPEE